MRRRQILALMAAIAAMAVPSSASPATRPTADPLTALAANARGRLAVHVSAETGVPDFVRAYPGAVLSRDGGGEKLEARARAFLASHGDAIGMSAAERRAVARPGAVAADGSELHLLRVDRDASGRAHVRFEQVDRGLPVFGAQAIVHLDRNGVTAVDGSFVPGVARAAKNAAVTPAAAGRIALDAVAKNAARNALSVQETTMQWYRHGLVQGYEGRSVLAYAVEVAGTPDGTLQVWVDATDGHVIVQIPLAPSAKERVVYTPKYDRKNPDMYVVRREGDPATHVPPADNLYEFTGQVYDFFKQGFGRDSYDAKGATMRTVVLVNNICPNAYWNGSTTNYCPAFDLDDVVAHEWGHAYTEKTHGLIYMCQSGALNEAYSDIWGETIDLTNGMDGVGGSNNDEPYPSGQRWIIGEDFTQPVQEVLLRDMWDPERLGSPGKVSDAQYVCANSSDNGGVHGNSGIPNHAYAMLVDGKSYNGQTIRGIGLVKAAHIYFQAMTAYQYPTIKFAGHEQSLLAACADLTGVDLRSPFTGAASGERITADDCTQVAKVAKAVELGKAPAQCQFLPILAKGVPAMCPGATMLFHDDFANGLSGWTPATQGVTEEWPALNWTTTSKSPGGHASGVAFAEDVDAGSCESGNDTSGAFSITGKPFTVPQGEGALRLRFDHYVATESADGGNVLVSVNDGAFEVIPASAYVFNPPPGAIATPLPGGSGEPNPKAGEEGWFGTDGGEAKGSWGTSVADLSDIAQPGDRVVLRFEMGLDCGGGIDGWYVDDVSVYLCPVLPAPSAVTVPDAPVSGPFTVSWTRPEGATGPDSLEKSAVSCAPLLFDDAESGLALWNTATGGTGAMPWETSTQKPAHSGAAFYARGLEGVTNASSDLILKQPLTIPPRSTAQLTFSDWFYNEGDDSVRIDASPDGGTTWKAVYTDGRSDYAPFATASFAQEALTPRLADLTAFAGTSILLRFRFTLGPDDRAASTPFGWYVDDISVRAESWTPVATTTGTAYRVAQLAAGETCFRVRTTFRVGGAAAPGRWSDASAPVRVAKTFGSSVKGVRKVAPAPVSSLPATGVGDGAATGVTLLAAALALTAFRKRGAA